MFTRTMIKVDGNFVDVAWLERRAELEDEAAVMWRRLERIGLARADHLILAESPRRGLLCFDHMAEECDRKAAEARAQIARMT